MKRYFIAISLGSWLLTACTIPLPSSPSAPVHQDANVRPRPVKPVEVVPVGRYTLVKLNANKDALQFPLRQITTKTIAIAKKSRPPITRGKALQHWLSGTGYVLCQPANSELRQLLTSPLPDIHHSMGPMRIKSALRFIAGPAWRMKVDEAGRTVCFQRAWIARTTGGAGK